MLQVEHRKVDFEDRGRRSWHTLRARGAPDRLSLKLFEEWCFPIASPELAAAIGEGAPERLLDHPLIHDSDAAGWRAWFAAQGIDYRPRPQDRRFEDYNLVLEPPPMASASRWPGHPWRASSWRPGGSSAVDAARR